MCEWQSLTITFLPSSAVSSLSTTGRVECSEARFMKCTRKDVKSEFLMVLLIIVYVFIECLYNLCSLGVEWC